MNFFYLLLLLTILALPITVGCGGGSEPQSPTVDELSNFLEDNPEIAAETENMGGFEDE